MPEEYVLRELARRLDEIASRFEALLSRLDTSYVRRDFFDVTTKLADEEHRRLSDATTTLGERVKDLESDKSWLVRTIVGFIVLAILGAVFVAAKVGP